MSELGVRIGGNIRTYRRANRMTLSELAERINKSKATVGKYEQGAIALDMDTLYEIAAALRVSPFQLMVSLTPEKKEAGELRTSGLWGSGGICTSTTAGPAGSFGACSSWPGRRATTR